jgi:hypothetical protein
MAWSRGQTDRVGPQSYASNNTLKHGLHKNQGKPAWSII